MSRPYTKGSRAFGFCDKTGFRYPLNELIYEVSNGVRTGMFLIQKLCMILDLIKEYKQAEISLVGSLSVMVENLL